MSLHNQIERYIFMIKPGTVITNNDFLDIASAKTVAKSLERLNKKGKIKKVMRGVFWKEDGINSSPKEEDVARAIAKANNWDIVPSGETALSYLNMTEKRPTKWTYITNGTYRKYEYDGKEIHFTHASGKWYQNLSDKTMLLIQAIKEYKRQKLGDDFLKKLASQYQPYEKKEILNQSGNVQSWISDIIKKMFGNTKLESEV